MSESVDSAENSSGQVIRGVETVDLSPALRIKSVLNWIRNIGFLPVTGLFFLSIADRRLILVAVIAYVAHARLARGSQTAAAVLVLLALAMALYFEGAYQEALARPEATDHRFRRLIELNRTSAWYCVGFGAVYIAGFVLAGFYTRRAWTPQGTLDWRQRVALQVGFLRARMTPKAVFYGALTLLCVLFVLAPALILLPSLVLHVPRTARTAPVLDWVFESYGSWWRIVVTFALVIASLRLWTRTKRHAALGLRRATLLDARPPLLLLRSFSDDTTPLERTSDQHSWKRHVVSPAIWTLEESIEHILRDHGPVIAVGRPGESLPPAGAAREYVEGDRWRSRIEQLVGEARLVLVVLGETEGLRFEYETLQRLGALPKMILVIPPRETEALAVRWRRFCEVFAPGRSNLTVDLSRVLAAYFSPEGVMTLVVCHRRDDEDCYSLALNRSLAVTLSSARRLTPRYT